MIQPSNLIVRNHLAFSRGLGWKLGAEEIEAKLELQHPASSSSVLSSSSLTSDNDNGTESDLATLSFSVSRSTDGARPLRLHGP